MRLRPGLLALGALLALGGLALFAASTPLDDLRSPAVASGLLLLALGAAAGPTRLPVPLGVPGRLLVASLLVSLFVAAGEGVGFLRQVRAQAGMTLEERRDVALEDRVHFRKGELARVQRLLPEDAPVLVLFRGGVNLYPAQLLAYYLGPRRVYFWRWGAPPERRFRWAAGPDPGWLRSRGIRFVVRVGGLSRLRVQPVEEALRP